jgi:hypothetical protein
VGKRTLDDVKDRPTAEYLIRSRDYRISETFSMRDQRYAEIDTLLRGEWGYQLPGDNLISEKPMVMNLGLTFTNDVARLVTEQSPVYKAPVYGDKKKDAIDAQIREVIGETYWIENRGDLTIPQQAIDLVVCGAAYTVSWTQEDCEYPVFSRVDPRHCYPNIQNGKMQDLLVINVFPAQVADEMYPGYGIWETAQDKKISGDVEVWQFYQRGYACVAVAHTSKGRGGPATAQTTIVREDVYPEYTMPAHFVQLPTHDGAIRGTLDQIGDSLQAKNKIVSLMTRYTEHKVFAPWEAKSILNAKETPGPNTVYMHDPNAPGDSFMRRVEPAGSDPALYALIQTMDLDQRGAIGYPASRQGEVGQSIASAAFVESTQGQLSSIIKNVQSLLADLRAKTTETMMALDSEFLDFEKPLHQGVQKKKTYKPSEAVGDRYKIRVMYGAGAGMSRENADNRVLNLLGARLLDRGTARDNVEFLRDRADIQDKIEMEGAEDALQQLFWPDPNIPIDVKFEVKRIMSEGGVGLSEAWDKASKEMQAKAAAAQAAAAPQPAEGQPVGPEGAQPTPTQATDQALALEKGQQVQQPADIELPSAPLEQIFVASQ